MIKVSLSKVAPRTLVDVVAEIENLRTAMADTTRRLRVALRSDQQFSMDSLYREVAGMRAASQNFTDIVDDMCRHCFPLVLTPYHEAILGYVITRSPVLEQRVQQWTLANRIGKPNIDELIAANYLARSNTTGRVMLVITDIGRAAKEGIFWAKAP